MKRFLVLYLFIVSLAYIVIGVSTLAFRTFVSSLNLMFFIPAALARHILVIPVRFHLNPWLGIIELLFGTLGIIGILLLAKKNKAGSKIWFLLSILALTAALWNIAGAILPHIGIKSFLGRGIYVRPEAAIISAFWALTYILSAWYLARSKKQEIEQAYSAQ